MFHRVISYLNYWLNEVNAHSLQSPFIYNVYNKYIINDINKDQFEYIEKTRKKLLSSDLLVAPANFGAASTVHPNESNVKVKLITKKGLTNPKISRLLTRLIEFNNSKQIIELGTSFGLNTLYLAHKESVQVTTFEGAKDIANIALTNFEYYEKKNINLIEGNIDKELPTFTNSRINIDFAYIDANHKIEPTLKYFDLILNRMNDNSILVLDDIYWSKEMTQAWETIKNHPQVTHTIDLYEVGIVFFKPDLVKSHFTLMF